jgi:hypothetical protein
MIIIYISVCVVVHGVWFLTVSALGKKYQFAEIKLGDISFDEH